MTDEIRVGMFGNGMVLIGKLDKKAGVLREVFKLTATQMKSRDLPVLQAPDGSKRLPIVMQLLPPCGGFAKNMAVPTIPLPLIPILQEPSDDALSLYVKTTTGIDLPRQKPTIVR